LSLIRISSVADLASSLNIRGEKLKERSRLLRSQYMASANQTKIKGLTKREIDVLLRFYRGISVKEQCERAGLSNKTIYTHRKEGMNKLHVIRQWLNDEHNFRAEIRDVLSNKNEGFTDKEVHIYNALLK
ncbi:diguanylate phosphodiesterase, partial [Escherichia coli]|nr:diguanylate phosphodiesterase [Escherichia coli]